MPTNSNIWMIVALLLIVVLIISHVAWMYSYCSIGIGCDSNHYKTELNIRSNISTITQSQLLAATNIKQLLIGSVKIPDLKNNNITIQLNGKQSLTHTLDTIGTEQVVDLNVDGIVLVLSLQASDTAGYQLTMGILAEKNISNITVNELRAFPAKITISYMVPNAASQLLTYIDYDLFGVEHYAQNIPILSPVITGRPAIQDVVLTTVHD